MKDYYTILGISKTASKDEVRKAFRKLASTYHPDKKTGDEEKFKEISEAYSVLSDDKKRAEYDAYGRSYSGMNGQHQHGGGFNWGGFGQGGFGGQGVEFDLNDIFENFGDVFGGGARSGKRQSRGNDISVDIELTFKESIFGTKRSLKLMKMGACTTCTGTGAAKGSEMIACTTCNGNGKIRETRQSILGNFTTVRECATCRGLGKVPKVKCPDCHAQGVRRMEDRVDITIPEGIEHGEMIRMTGRGEAVQGGISGDLYIKIHVARHHEIVREGNNLIRTISIKLSDALLGGMHGVETLDGTVKIKIPEGVKHGELLRIREKGVPSSSGRGDFLVKINIDMPKKLSRTARKLVEDLQREGL